MIWYLLTATGFPPGGRRSVEGGSSTVLMNKVTGTNCDGKKATITKYADEQNVEYELLGF